MRRLIAVIQTWLLYGLTLVPIFLFNRQHPQALLRRLYEISYIRPGVPFREIASEFVRRYLEDQSLYALLLTGDYHPRHHVQGSGGALLFATFILAMIGLLLVFTRGWRDPWWLFVTYGLAASIVPGALTNEPFHQLRLMAYPVFLLVLTVPALEWLLAPHSPKKSGEERSRETIDGRAIPSGDWRDITPGPPLYSFSSAKHHRPPRCSLPSGFPPRWAKAAIRVRRSIQGCLRRRHCTTDSANLSTRREMGPGLHARYVVFNN